MRHIAHRLYVPTGIKLNPECAIANILKGREVANSGNPFPIFGDQLFTALELRYFRVNPCIRHRALARRHVNAPGMQRSTDTSMP